MLRSHIQLRYTPAAMHGRYDVAQLRIVLSGIVLTPFRQGKPQSWEVGNSGKASQ